ncbi:uncharacterized protein LOC142585303 [Dermacentor variabilis]|uniref:uncharacterized protein LOC142585303 n=1 Tax=Dermacentor variabilis TaxID=34621 RepID=UPI003F5B8C1D
MGSLIVDSILTPFSWYSLLPIVGFAAFLSLVAAYQRTQFYWITDRAGDVAQYVAARFRKKPRRSQEPHVPWFIAGNASPASPGIAMTTFQMHHASAAAYAPEAVGAAPSSGAPAVLSSGTSGQMDTASRAMPIHAHGSGHLPTLPAVPVLIKVTDLSEWRL